MRHLLLPLLLLLAGCASPEGAQAQFYGLRTSTAVPFADGRVLGLDKNHNPAWIDDAPKGTLRAKGFTPATPGEDVVIRTRYGELWAHILHVEGPRVLFVTQTPLYPGMSGAGLWREDRWLVGVVMARDDRFWTLGEGVIPFIYHGEAK